MLGKATPKIGDRVDELVGNIQKKLCGGDGGERVKGENRREEMVYVFDLRFGLDVWVHAEGKVLDRPTHTRITRCRFTPRGVTTTLPSPSSPHWDSSMPTVYLFKFKKRNTSVAPTTIVVFTFI